MSPFGSSKLAARQPLARPVAVAVMLLCLGACGSSPATRSQPAVAVKNRAAVRPLPCRESIGSDPAGRDMTVVLGVVGLPASPRLRLALQTARTGSRDPATRLFAKWGLVVRAGARFVLIVPARLRGRLSIGWGNAREGHVGQTIRVPGCLGGRGQRWLDFAGGYWVRSPICAPLIVEARGLRRRVWVGIGTACPGQRPPPQPTQT